MRRDTASIYKGFQKIFKKKNKEKNKSEERNRGTKTNDFRSSNESVNGSKRRKSIRFGSWDSENLMTTFFF